MGEQQHIQPLSPWHGAGTAEGLRAGEPAQPCSLQVRDMESHWHRPTGHVQLAGHQKKKLLK